VGNGAAALKYLAPYIFRVAISNNRIVKLENDQVTFRYQDAKTNETKYCTLAAEAFIQRFLQHILPKGFMKVRYYGFLSAGNRGRLRKARNLLGVCQPAHPEDDQETKTVLTEQALRCPQCGQVMQRVQTIRAKPRWPP
jgi:ribosomal protein L44E